MLTDKGIEAIRDRLKKATKGPWKWTIPGAGFPGPQLEGNIQNSDMNPVLMTAGCSSDKGGSKILGCMPEKLNDPLRACPLHPMAGDRDFIAQAYCDIEDLLDYVNTLRNWSEVCT